MGKKFWVKRFLSVLAGAFIIIGVAQMFKGHDFTYAVTQAAIWGIITASVFTVGRLYQSRRGQQCALCKDTPKMQQADRASDVQ